MEPFINNNNNNNQLIAMPASGMQTQLCVHHLGHGKVHPCNMQGNLMSSHPPIFPYQGHCTKIGQTFVSEIMEQKKQGNKDGGYLKQEHPIIPFGKRFKISNGRIPK